MAAPSYNVPLDVEPSVSALSSNTTSTVASTMKLPQSNLTLPHITAMPCELLLKIVSHLEDPSLAILSLTCRNMRDRVPQPSARPSLQAVALEVPSLVGANAGTITSTTKIRLWSLVKKYMYPRIYAGNYGVCKFLGVDAYNRARDAYWEKFPCIPLGILTPAYEPYVEPYDEPYDENADGLGESAYLLERLGFRFEDGRDCKEQEKHLRGKGFWCKQSSVSADSRISLKDYKSFAEFKARLIKVYQEHYSGDLTEREREIEKAIMEEDLQEAKTVQAATPLPTPPRAAAAVTSAIAGFATFRSIFGPQFPASG